MRDMYRLAELKREATCDVHRQARWSESKGSVGCVRELTVQMLFKVQVITIGNKQKAKAFYYATQITKRCVETDASIPSILRQDGRAALEEVYPV
jgi:hypothetical protein